MSCVAREKMEGDPHLLPRELLQVAVVEGAVGGAQAVVHRPVGEAHGARVGGVVDVLGGVGDHARVVRGEPREATDDVGDGVMEVDLHGGEDGNMAAGPRVKGASRRTRRVGRWTGDGEKTYRVCRTAADGSDIPVEGPEHPSGQRKDDTTS
jgi:hypothetical protein